MKKRRYEAVTSSSGKNWSMLPGDVLSKILENLSFPDCLHAISACKGWKIQIPANSRCFLPWIIEQDWSKITASSREKLSCTVKIHQPQNPEPYLTVCRTFDLPCGCDSSSVIAMRDPDGVVPLVRDAKLGWLLVEIPSARLLVLYSPFVDDDDHHARVLLFPPWMSSISQATFSSPPTSSDCVVFAVTKETEKVSGTIHTWCCCDNAWKQHIVQEASSWVYSAMSMDRTLYCLVQDGRMLVFNSSNSASKTVAPPIESCSWELKYLAAVNGGEVLLICQGLCEGPDCFKVYRYEMASNSWVPKPRLDGQALFLEFPYYCAYAAPAQMDNRLYEYCIGYSKRRNLYYSFVDGQMHIDSSGRFMFPSYEHKPWGGKFIFLF